MKLILQAFSLLWMMFVAMPAPKAILLQVTPACYTSLTACQPHGMAACVCFPKRQPHQLQRLLE